MKRRDDPLTKAQHEKIGRDLFNYAWSLIDRRDRTAEEDDEMIHAAHASRYHWGRGGTALNHSIAERRISRVYSILDRAEPARYHGRLSLELALHHRLPAFYVAYGYEAVARAAGVQGNRAQRTLNLLRAKRLAPSIRDIDDRRMLLDDLETIL